MTTLLGFSAAVLIVVSLLALVALAGAATTLARATVRASREDVALREDLERVLDDILGQRSVSPDA